MMLSRERASASHGSVEKINVLRRSDPAWEAMWKDAGRHDAMFSSILTQI